VIGFVFERSTGDIFFFSGAATSDIYKE